MTFPPLPFADSRPGPPGIPGALMQTSRPIRPNLIANSSFETNTTGWQTDGTNTIATSTDVAKFGAQSAKATFVSGGDRYRLAEYPMTFTAADRYTFSVYVYIPTAYAGQDVHVRSSNYVGGTEVIGHAVMALRDQWQRISLSLTVVGGDLAGELRVSEDNGSVSNGNFIYIDGAKLENSPYATAFNG